MANALQGQKVLVVEDDGIIALDLRMGLEGSGCRVVAVVSTVEEAERRAEDEELDLALLDVQVNDSTTFGVADRLIARRIPFVFITGYSVDALPGHLAGRHVLRKPFSPKRLLAVLEQVMSGIGPASIK